MRTGVLWSFGAICALASAASASVIVPDNGGGTIDFPPPGANYTTPNNQFMIISGFQPGAWIEIEGVLSGWNGVSESAGGSLGGHTQSWAAGFQMSLSGFGIQYSRHAIMLVFGQTDIGLRMPNQPLQSFPSHMMSWQSQLLPGDPDFDLLRITAGASFGLPSPGQTTLTQVGTAWEVDSYFDLNYRIDFIGRAGGPLAGLASSTTGTIRISVVPTPGTATLLGCTLLAACARRRRGNPAR